MGTPEEVATDSPDQADIRRLARSLVEDLAGLDRLRELDEAERFDEELYTALAQAGLIGLGADASAGRDSDPEHQIVVLEELAAGPTSMAVCLVVQYMGVRLLCSFGTDEQRRSLLAPLVEGRERVAFALSEADGGTDIARAMRTRARRTEEGWIVNGTKTWISGAATARHAIVLARTGPAEPSAIDGISTFVVPLDSRGLTVRRLGTVAIHGLDTCEIIFDDVALDGQAILGEPNSGFRQVIATLNGERLNAAASALGIARGALTTAINYARDRTAFGRPIGAFQALQHALADGAIKVEAARGLLNRAPQPSAAATTTTPSSRRWPRSPPPTPLPPSPTPGCASWAARACPASTRCSDFSAMPASTPSPRSRTKCCATSSESAGSPCPAPTRPVQGVSIPKPTLHGATFDRGPAPAGDYGGVT